MKKIYVCTLAFFLLYIGCTEDEVADMEVTDIEVINTDISVTSSESLIFWLDNNDLLQKLDNALTYNYGNALESEIEKNLSFNSDSTEVIASVNFKQEFQSNYFDSNISNNSAIISLQNESNIPIDDLSILGVTGSQVCEMLDLLENELPNFDLTSQSFICIPITFQVPESININQNVYETAINNLNNNFGTSKIAFELSSVNTIPDNLYYNLNVGQIDNFENDIINTLNVYISHTLQENGNQYNGLAHFPNENIDRVYVRDDFFNLSRDPESAVLIHEIGHFFSLLHTFQQNIPSYCITDNDHINITPIDNFGINTTNASTYYGSNCNPNDSNFELLIRNFMSYSINAYSLRNCDRSFITEQHIRIAFSARQWKQNLYCMNNSNQSNISLSNDINFGNVEIGQSETRQLTIENTGNESFNVTNITSSNTAFTISGNSSVVQPNSSINVPIQFAPTQQQSYSGVITVDNTADNANSSNSTIQVTGTGFTNTNNSSNISITGNLNFGNVEIGQSDTRTFSINNTGNQSFNVSSINFPSNTFSANFNSGTINPSNPQEVIVTFQPTNAQAYNGTVTVNNNADSGNNSIAISGNGINTNTGQPNLIYNDYNITSDDNSNDIVEAGEDIDFDIELQNTGSATATNIEVIIATNDPDIDIIDNDRTYDDMPAGDFEWNGGNFDFLVSPSCPTKTVVFTMQINSDQGSWTDSFTINVQGQNSGGLPQQYAVNSPRDNCAATGSSDSYRLDLNTIYYRNNWNINNIIGYGSDGNRGMWYRFRTTTAGSYTINLTMNGNPGFELFTVCGASSVATNDNSNSNTETGTFTINSANTDIYIRFFDNNDNSNVDFEISIEH